MRLLEITETGELKLTKDIVKITEPYAILSHTWADDDDDEVSFKDLTECTWKNKAGYKKLMFCRDQAIADSLQYFWIDTCCIDKSNSAELSEAINSMFRWYRNSTKCYVYLSDVSTNNLSDISVTNHQINPSAQPWESAFRQSRWFTRGWTLQELIAPQSVDFFCSNGKRLGNKQSLEQQLHEITGIAVTALQGASLSTFSVNDRLSWAKHRKTKREEDKAYSLLGIFDIHMPWIYGETEENAFRRLYEEIEKSSRKRPNDDQWNMSYGSSNLVKRAKILNSHSSSIQSSSHQNFLAHELHPHSEYLLSNDNLDPPGTEILENREYSNTNISHGMDATTKQSLIEQLYFTKIDERLTSLTAAQGTTCRWFLAKPEFMAWYNLEQQPTHGGFLWIKGNPGTGKSTLMKFLFEEAKLNAKRNSLQLTISFFFLARGTVEENSTEGLYRSLLHQLFEKAEDLRDSLEWITVDGAKVIQRNGWREENLKQTLKHAIQKLGNRSLMIFIDALDECEEKQTADMVCFFEELCDHGEDSQVRLQICFSSRYYPTIVIQKGIEIFLENEIGHTKDIENYLKSKLRLGKSKQAESLRAEILEKSSGIFLWVVLVLDILNSEYPHLSVSIKRIRGRLKEIPPKLNDLFEMILTRDKENLEHLQLCLKCVLFATRPLKPQELYFAIQLGLDRECSTYWDPEDVDLDQMKTFVRSSSKGLVEVTRNKASEVQFIHESIRDFLLDKFKGQWSGVSGNATGHCHQILRDCCLAQLNTSIDHYVKLPNPPMQASKAADLRETIRSKFPFVEYSIHNVLRHSNSAQENSINQEDFLASFPFQHWTFLSNTLEKFDTRQYTDSVSMLYILAEKNLAELIRIHPQRESCFDIGSERYGPPIFAALATGSHEAVQIFLEIQAIMLPENTSLFHIGRLYSQNRKIHFSFGRDFTFSKKRGIVSYAAEMGQEEILILLGALGQLHANSKDRNGVTPLMHAAERGYAAVVRLLIEEGAELGARDEKAGQTPLLRAAKGGHEAVVKLLLEKCAELETKDSFYHQTPLSWAAKEGHEAVVKLLLEKGAVLETKDSKYGQTPLSWAAEGGHEAVVKLLLEKGAEFETKDYRNQTPLIWAAKRGYEAVVKLLLEKGAEAEIKDSNYGQTPLSWAAERGYFGMVKLLLEAGADINSKNNYGLTPLDCAIERGHKDVIELLKAAQESSFQDKV